MVKKKIINSVNIQLNRKVHPEAMDHLEIIRKYFYDNYKIKLDKSNIICKALDSYCKNLENVKD